MGSRPILGGNTPDDEQRRETDAASAQAAQPKSPDLPLAIELPNWDLVPPDTLLVRRRTAKK